MSYEKEQLLKKILFREEILGLVEPKHSPDGSYKTKDPKTGKELAYPVTLGTKLICAYAQYKWNTRMSTDGYFLGVVLYVFEKGWRQEALVQVVKVSHPGLGHLVGTLRVVDLPRDMRDGFSSVVGVVPYVKWEDYKLPEERFLASERKNG